LGLLLGAAFGRERAKIVLVGPDRLELSKAAEHIGGEVDTIACDVTDKSQVEEMVETILRKLGRIDVLVNDSGTIEIGHMDAMTLEDYETSMKSHFWGPLHCILTVLPAMKAKKFGRIVNITSIGGKVSVPHLLPYSASKHALVGLSEGLRSELLKENIFVTTVCPGLMRTGLLMDTNFKSENEKEYSLLNLVNALPITTAAAEAAAVEIVKGVRYGEAEVVISLPAQALSKLYGLFPTFVTDLFGVANTVLPGPATDRARKNKVG
jgi:NAD(P)-dependent dehydrogenase (short-subunit alcohol dehydrogenase family)